ncbi:MAG: DUF4258 domain-containing protein [Spirochaetes bacterium]|nr:DUF4258 domain-containing protein [Spirochaetota bacterium]
MINEIKQKIRNELYEYSEHAVNQSIIRMISENEIREAIEHCKIIENYPEDKYGPSCLIYGRTNKGRPIHIQCSYPSRPLIRIITVYEPDINLWIDFKIRR